MNSSSSDLMSYCSLAKNNLSFREAVGIVFPSFSGFNLHILVIHSLLEMLLLVIEHCNQPLLATICSLLLPSLIIWCCCHYWWNYQLNQKQTKLFFRLYLKKYKTTLFYTKKDLEKFHLFTLYFRDGPN